VLKYLRKDRRRTGVTVSILAAASLGAWGCPDSVVDTTSGGNAVVNRGALRDTAVLVEVWRAGAVEMSRASRISAVAVAPDGTVFGAGSAAQLFRISRDGSTTTRLALPTSWAGANITAMAIDSAGDLVILDAGGRLGRFDRDGSPIEERPIESGQLLWGTRALTVDASGATWIGIHPGHGAEYERMRYPRAVFRRLDPTHTADTVWLPDRLAAECPVVPERRFQSGWFEDLRARYVPFVVWTMSGTGSLVAGCPSTYSFELDAGSPTPTRVEVTPWTPVRVGREELQDFELTWRALLSTRTGSPAAASDLDLGPWPDHKPAYSALLYGGDGRTWVWTPQPSTRVAANPTWSLAGLPDVLWIESGLGTFDVFDSRGRLVGHVRLPADLRYTATPDTPEPVIRGDTLWAGIVTTEGPASVVRFQVAWP
jgi:hypothetical protein